MTKKYIYYVLLIFSIFAFDHLFLQNVLFKTSFQCSSIKRCSLLTSLQFATPLIILGLSFIVAYKSKLFNLGQEGQMYLGILFSGYLGYGFDLPDNIHSIVISIGAIIVGGLYGWFAGWLKIRLGINEIISTIILSEIIINAPISNNIRIPYYGRIHETAMLKVFAPGSKFGTGFVIAVFAVILVYFYLWKSGKGYEQRMSGEAPRFAFFGGIKSEKAALRGMFISGGLAGLAGAIEVMGVHYRIVNLPINFDGMLVGFISFLNPILVFFVSIIVGGLRNGFQLGLQYTLGLPREVGSIILISFLILLFLKKKVN
jgi:general nucleoside transport system permease protein